MRQTLFVAPNQTQEILALVKPMAKLPRSAAEPGFHPGGVNEPVLLWNTDGRLACTAISSCHPIPPPVPLSRVSLPPQPLCLAALLSALSPVPHRGPSFCFSLLLRVFLLGPFSPSLTTPAQLSGFLSTLCILNTSSTSAASLLPRHRLPSWHQHIPLLSDLCSSFSTSLPLFPAFGAVPRAQ